MVIKKLGGAGITALATFSIVNLPSISNLGLAQSLLIVGILGATFVLLWGKNTF